MTINKKLGRFPFAYQESIIFVAIIILIGYFIQVEQGALELARLKYPVNIIIAAAILILSAASSFVKTHPIIRWFSSIPLTVCLLAALLILGVIMGITTQRVTPELGELYSTLGFRHMPISWPFVLIYALVLLSLGFLIARRLTTAGNFSIVFHLNHMGLFILLLAGVLSNTDMRRFVVYPYLGEGPQNRSYHTKDFFVELPIGVQLDSFRTDSFPAKIAILDEKESKPLPLKNPILFQVGTGTSSIQIMDWKIDIEQYIHQAAKKGDIYTPWMAVGSTPAAKLTAHNVKTGETHQGWISPGSVGGLAQAFKTMPLGNDQVLVMLPPEAKSFISKITIFTEDGEKQQAELTVNSPITIGAWKLYQYDYDQEARDMSSYSGIELVYDPWIKLVYLGFALLGLGAVGLVWSGRRKNKEIK